MKITEISQPKHLQQVDGNADGKTAAQKKTASQRKGGDVVELSAALDEQLTVRQEEMQARRVASIKARVQAGTYEVGSGLVAEKMLSTNSGI